MPLDLKTPAALLKVLGNETRLRILLVLARNRDENLTAYKIAKLSELDGRVVRAHLPMLLEASLIICARSRLVSARVPPVHSYSINKDSAVVQRIVALLAETSISL